MRKELTAPPTRKMGVIRDESGKDKIRQLGIMNIPLTSVSVAVS